MTKTESVGQPLRDAPVELSVVIPMFDAASTITAQLHAVLSQNWSGSWEVIVVDNGSTDGSREVAAAMAATDTRVRVVDASDRHGPAHARNRGASVARGTALAFCDADDVVTPGWLAAIGEALRHHPAVTGPQAQDLLNEPAYRNVYGAALSTGAQRFAGAFPFGPSANLGVSRDVFEDLGGFDPAVQVGEDLEFCLRLWHHGHDLAFVPDAAIEYRNRATTGALWRQAVRYGAAGPMIVKRMITLGHPAPPRLRGLRNWMWLVRSLPILRTLPGRARWCVVAGGATGRLLGSLRHRTLYC